MTNQSKDARQFIRDAYDLQDAEDIKAFYAKWAGRYDEQMIEGLRYLSPVKIAGRLQAHVSHHDAIILDIGCGTGLTARPLADAGYRRLWGVDLCAEMIAVSVARGIYENLLTADVNEKFPYADNQFDGIVSSGTFTHGHVGPEPFAEMLRVLRQGGIIACSIHRDLWEKMGFADTLEAFNREGRLTEISRELEPCYAGEDPELWFCVYRKTG